MNQSERELPVLLRQRIIETGEISSDGAILRFKEFNRDGLIDLIVKTAEYMADWIRLKFPDINQEDFKVVVVDSSGRDLAAFVAWQLGIARTVIKKDRPTTMFGDVLEEEIHSFTRKRPVKLAVEEKDIHGKRLIAVDDFAASGDTLEAVERMAQRATGELAAIVVGISKPGQGSGEIMRRIPSLAVVEIETMTAATATEPAKIRFVGQPEQVLQRRWGDG